MINVVRCSSSRGSALIRPTRRQVVAATAYLHSHSIVHRDLKPENILYKTRDPNSQLVIADFGIAKHLEPDEELTCTAGSVGYAAPEVLTGKGHGMKVDLWSIGWVDRPPPRKGMVLAVGFQ